MAESITITAVSKEEKYRELYPQLASLVAGEKDLTANLANIGSALASTFSYFLWTGFYLKRGDELVLGPFQGNVACTRIAIGKGVCGKAAAERRTLLVPDVSKFPGHIVCDPTSKSEVVVPICRDSKVHGVLDVDSNMVSAFEREDVTGLERIVSGIVLPLFEAG